LGSSPRGCRFDSCSCYPVLPSAGPRCTIAQRQSAERRLEAVLTRTPQPASLGASPNSGCLQTTQIDYAGSIPAEASGPYGAVASTSTRFPSNPHSDVPNGPDHRPPGRPHVRRRTNVTLRSPETRGSTPRPK